MLADNILDDIHTSILSTIINNNHLKVIIIKVLSENTLHALTNISLDVVNWYNDTQLVIIY